MRIQANAEVVKLVEKGELTLEEYLNLFQVKRARDTMVEWKGWDIIQYYLYHIADDVKFDDGHAAEEPNIPPSRYYAACIYNQYVAEKGVSCFQKEVVSQAGRKIDINWLRNQFAKLAETHEGFTYDAWTDLCKLDNGRICVHELLFQMRLLWIQWLREGKGVEAGLKPNSTENGLPHAVVSRLNAFFEDYVDKRGLDRFHKNVLLRLRKKELGISWFREKLTQPLLECPHVTADEWERFLVDPSGRDMTEEREFQMHLYLSNLYRNKMGGT